MFMGVFIFLFTIIRTTGEAHRLAKKPDIRLVGNPRANTNDEEPMYFYTACATLQRLCELISRPIKQSYSYRSLHVPIHFIVITVCI